MNTLVIGVGNEYRGDDAIGLIVARRVRALNLPNVQVIESDGEFTKLMESWKDAVRVILIDAVQSGAAIGTIHRVDVNKEELSTRLFSASTHAFGVAEAIALSKAMGQLPECFTIFGIEARNFEMGSLLSVEVATAVEKILRLAQDEMSDHEF